MINSRINAMRNTAICDLELYKKAYPMEAATVNDFLLFLKNKNAFNNAKGQHVTASAIIYDIQSDSVMLRYHKR